MKVTIHAMHPRNEDRSELKMSTVLVDIDCIVDRKEGLWI